MPSRQTSWRPSPAIGLSGLAPFSTVANPLLTDWRVIRRAWCVAVLANILDVIVYDKVFLSYLLKNEEFAVKGGCFEMLLNIDH